MKKLLGHLSGRLQAAVHVSQAQWLTPASCDSLRIHGLCLEHDLEALAGRERCRLVEQHHGVCFFRPLYSTS